MRSFRGTILMVTHDAYFARNVGFSRHWHLADGVVDSTIGSTVDDDATAASSAEAVV